METYLDIIPREIVMEIFSYLDIDELDMLKLNGWSHVINNNFWRFALFRKYPDFKITDLIYPKHPIPTNEYYVPDWPVEYIGKTYQIFINDYRMIYYVRSKVEKEMISRYKCHRCGSVNVTTIHKLTREKDELIITNQTCNVGCGPILWRRPGISFGYMQ